MMLNVQLNSDEKNILKQALSAYFDEYSGSWAMCEDDEGRFYELDDQGNHDYQTVTARECNTLVKVMDAI